MLEKFITNLKKSLPGGQKNEEEDVETSEDSLDEESDSESSEEDEKKKKVSMLIRVVVIIGLGYVAVDHFFLSAPEQSLEQLTAKAPKRRKKPVVVADENKTAVQSDIKAIANNSATDTESASSSIESTSTSPEAPVESINILDKNAEVSSGKEEVEVEAEVVKEVPETTPDIPAETPKSTIGENNLDQRLDQLIGDVEKKEDPKEQTPSMEDKIVQEEAAYTNPPAYNIMGRGLVYNCKDKYWACVDKPSYVSCNKNMKWNSNKGNAKECAVQNVYSSEEDCIKVQKYNVSINQATDFCQ